MMNPYQTIYIIPPTPVVAYPETTSFVVLPSIYRELRISQMKTGQAGYVEADAMRVDTDGKCYLNGGYIVSPVLYEPEGYTLAIQKDEYGYVVDISKSASRQFRSINTKASPIEEMMTPTRGEWDLEVLRIYGVPSQVLAHYQSW